jgi:hypothetical protein
MAATATHELPPMLRGSEQQQLTDIRDYLVRLATSLNKLDNATVISSSSSDKVTKKLTEDIKQQATDLRSLIIKTADALDVRIETNSDSIDDINGTISTLGNTYVAQSQFGAYQETVLQTIQNTAKNIVESYDYASQITALNDDLHSLSEYLTMIDGEIRRGVIEDPLTHQDVLGIAISQKLVFVSSDQPNASKVGPDQEIYYRIDTTQAQTFGLYTSTGWQFWINGQKVGWFDSTAETALHVASMITESNIQFGENWLWDQNSNGIGLRYIGS